MYGYLFAITGIYIIFALFQDLKYREIANWLTFSLIAIGLAYRLFYSFEYNEYNLFYYGLLGFCLFFLIAQVFYYTRMFGGGDAKLLMGIGTIIPYNSYLSVLLFGLGFIFILLLSGSVYSLICSVFIAINRRKLFVKEFKRLWNKYKIKYSFILLVVGLILTIINYYWIILVVLSVIIWIFIYLKAVDKCMVVLKNANDLTEGDWMEQEIKIGRKLIGKSVHGLSMEDIKLLKKYGKKVLIKEGIPFMPAFVISFIIMVFFYSTSGYLDYLAKLF